jgi:molybdenum cofactor synthesis domain-containing protein
VTSHPGPDRPAYPSGGEPAAADRAVVICASTRAATGVYADTTGPLIVTALRQWGFDVEDAVVVPDGQPVAGALSAALATAPAVVLTTGGTGISPTDVTPEMTRGLLDREVVGIADAIRAAGIAKGVPTAMLSRGLAGISGPTLVVNLPGSTGGVRDALEVLEAVLTHAIDQIRGGDHR